MTTQFVKNPIKCFSTTITVLPCVSCTPDVHGIPGEGPDRHQSAARTLRPLLGVVDELPRKMLILLPVRRSAGPRLWPRLWPLHDAALLRANPKVTTANLAGGQNWINHPLETQKLGKFAKVEIKVKFYIEFKSFRRIAKSCYFSEIKKEF